MTTLIDRIIESMRKCFGIHYINSKEENILKGILEAELTAVKGVDELVEKYSKSQGIVNVRELISDLKALKQTPVTSECKHCRDFNGDGTKTCTDCLKNVPVENLIIEERLKNSTSNISSIGQFSTQELWDELGKRLLSK